MGKKANTVLFMVVMTIVSLLIMLICFTVFTAIVLFIGNKVPSLQENQTFITLSVLMIFVFSTALSFFIYNKLVKWAVKKWDLEDKMYPFFAPRNRRQ